MNDSIAINQAEENEMTALQITPYLHTQGLDAHTVGTEFVQLVGAAMDGLTPEERERKTVKAITESVGEYMESCTPEMTNKYASECEYCSEQVPPNHGALAQEGADWVVAHIACLVRITDGNSRTGARQDFESTPGAPVNGVGCFRWRKWLDEAPSITVGRRAAQIATA